MEGETGAKDVRDASAYRLFDEDITVADLDVEPPSKVVQTEALKWIEASYEPNSRRGTGSKTRLTFGERSQQIVVIICAQEGEATMSPHTRGLQGSFDTR